ncbi:MAG: sigma-54 dependent transcriptional regulator [Terracidiphilus sp.]
MSPFLLVVAVVQNSEIRSMVRMVFGCAGHRLIECDSCQQAQLLLSNGLSPDLLLVACSLADPVETAQRRLLLQSIFADKVCLIAGPADEALRKEAVALGVRHILAGPVMRGDLESMLDSMNQPVIPSATGNKSTSTCAGSSRLNSEIPVDMPAPPYLEELDGGNFFLAASPKMLEIHRQVKLLADTDFNVLILGESGTGKEVIAQLIHRNSRRSREKFLKVNCAALPADLLESELFGYRRGAFTGAIKDQPGKFEQADGGTLLLDEIGEIGVQIQAKLLHVLQDGQFTRLGAQSCSKVNVRVLAATNVHMDDALLDKTFREDLYYRLSVFTIHVPPLRERREEVPYFMEETIRRASAEMKSGLGDKLPSRLLDAALLYDWPGNLRELRNFVTRTVVMRDLDAAARELEVKIESARGITGLNRSEGKLSMGSGMRSIVRDLKERTEMQMIQDALEASRWNRRQAAQCLNISYRALLYKIQQHRLTPRTSRNMNEAPASGYSAWRDDK